VAFQLLVLRRPLRELVASVHGRFAWDERATALGPALAHGVNDAVRNAFMLGL
jgi:hypothetical protein